MILSAIVATDNSCVIGKEGGIPWYLPADLAHFKAVTMGHPIIMGRKTHESIGKALPGRSNIVITRDKDYEAEDCKVVGSLDEALSLVKGETEAFIIGGQSIYELAMSRIDRIYLTKIAADIPGDKYFKYDPAKWAVIESQKHQKDEKNSCDYEFIILQRKTAK